MKKGYRLYWNKKVGYYIMLIGEPIPNSVFVMHLPEITDRYKIFARPNRKVLSVDPGGLEEFIRDMNKNKMKVGDKNKKNEKDKNQKT